MIPILITRLFKAVFTALNCQPLSLSYRTEST